MSNSIAVGCALALLAAAAGPAPAQVAVAKDYGTPGPGTIAGFLDPATGRFVPSVPGGQAAGQPVSGTFTVMPAFHFDRDIGRLDLVFCTVTLEFGSIVGGQLLPDHSASANVNFLVGVPDKQISVPYEYTPNNAGAMLALSVSCIAYGESGAGHSLTITYPAQPLPSGAVTQALDVAF